MISKIWCLFTLIFCFLSITAYPDHILDSTTLISVNMFDRHGARSPVIDPPPDAKFTPVDWPKGSGILTRVGKETMHSLGAQLRKRYATFLSPTYIENELFVMTTQVPRTQISAKATLAGLYDVPVEDFLNNEDVLSHIPIYTDYDKIDKSEMINTYECPVFKSEQSIAIKATKAANDVKYRDVYDHYTKHSSTNINGMYDLFPIWDNLECLRHNKIKLPDWASPYYPIVMSEIQAKVLRSLIVGTQRMIQIAAGPYMKELHGVFSDLLSGNSQVPKLRIHGGHDFSMTANLAALQVFEKIVNPGDAILIEVHKLPDVGLVVQVLYVRAGGEFMELLNIGDCPHPCPIQDFMEIIQYAIPRDWYFHCKSYVY